MHFSQLMLLAIVQGAAELLPVSSSAHVIVAEKLMGLDPTAPQMTLLLVMLHTGTMFAVIVYFWNSWRTTYFASAREFGANVLRLAIATLLTAIVGLALLQLIQYLAAGGQASGFEVERLFGNPRVLAVALAAAGVLIIVSSRIHERADRALSLAAAACIGAVQGLCLPFRGFSRSGATISTGLALGVPRRRAEEFSFALAVVLTPAVDVREIHRLFKQPVSTVGAPSTDWWHLLAPDLLGMLLSFGAGLLALRWLSRWLEHGRWHYFGGYCLLASLLVLWIG